VNDEDLKRIASETKQLQGNIEQLKQKQENIVSDIKEDIKKWYKRYTAYAIGSFSLLTILALFQIYTNVKNKSEEFITKSITLKFAEPKIADTLNEVAKTQAKEIIETHLNPAIQKTIKEVLKSKEKTIEINEISQLGSRINWRNTYGGDRQSYEILLDKIKETKDPEINKILSIEIKAAESIYDPRIMVPIMHEQFAICQLHKDCKEIEPPTGYNAENVFHHLTERIWTERAESMHFLVEIGKTPVFISHSHLS